MAACLPVAVWTNLVGYFQPEDPTFANFMFGPHGLFIVLIASTYLAARNFWILWSDWAIRREYGTEREDFRRFVFACLATGIAAYLLLYHRRSIYLGNRELVYGFVAFAWDWTVYALSVFWVRCLLGALAAVGLWMLLENLLFGFRGGSFYSRRYPRIGSAGLHIVDQEEWDRIVNNATPAKLSISRNSRRIDEFESHLFR